MMDTAKKYRRNRKPVTYKEMYDFAKTTPFDIDVIKKAANALLY